MILDVAIDKLSNDEVTAGDIVAMHTISDKLKLIERELTEAKNNITAISTSLQTINKRYKKSE